MCCPIKLLSSYALRLSSFPHSSQKVSKPMRGNFFTCQLLRSYPSDEFGNKECAVFEDASWDLNGTDPRLSFPLRLTYTTRPPQHLCEKLTNERRSLVEFWLML
uniref:Uncharacterized protein n=1 Tax=Heterorhabditis bacteriophora TaxID=37862 RepID=A0A1I7WIE8_HETBA